MKQKYISILKTAGVHILCWALFFYLPFTFSAPRNAPGMGMHQQQARQDTLQLMPAERQSLQQLRVQFAAGHQQPADMFKRRMLTNGLLQVLVFYINAYWLFPVFYLNRRRRIYAAWLLALVAVYGMAHYLLMQVFEPDMPGPGFGFVFPLLMVLAASTAFALLKERIQAAEREKELTLRNLQGELAFLRSQMNPHFIFNVLNGMVSLARKRSDNLEPALLKLSGMIRYSLYDADVAKVPVEKEISYLENYIELQRLRFGDEVIIKAEIGTPPSGLYISPMLLIPFVENAFKHGLGVTEAAISVSLRFAEDELQLRVLNRFDPNAPAAQETGGIGLKNVKRRLELLYPGRYNLSITENIDFFVVQLKITADHEEDKMHSN